MIKECSRCVLDSHFPNISFDKNGECSICHQFDKMDEKFKINENNFKNLMNFIKKIKAESKDKEYDCIQGVSGGRDSSYCLYLLKKWGLNPLAIHFDNNMDSDIALENIKKICDKLEVDLITYHVDWDEFKDLQKSFFKASIPAIDTPTDHAFITVLYNMAYVKKIRYIFSGASFRTEGPCAPGWSSYEDVKLIRSIHNKFGNLKLRKYPIRTTSDLLKWRLNGIMEVRPLNFIEYTHREAMPKLERELGWKYYGGHHFESILTRWISAYYLPKKFGIDKRIIDYAVLVRSGHITRNEALLLMKKNDFYHPEQEKEDRQFIMKRLEFDDQEMKDIINSPPKRIIDYPIQSKWINLLQGAIRPKTYSV